MHDYAELVGDVHGCHADDRDRHSDAENVQFEILSEDWTRMVLLQADRTLEFHSQSGMHYKTRIPRFGRDLAYLRSTCDLLAVGAGNEVFRLNLDQGQFLQPWQTSLSGINVVEINPVHQLTALGGEGGVCEFWDPRARKAVSLLELAPFLGGYASPEALEALEVSSFHFLPDGLTCALGTSTGQVMLFDLRNHNP